MFNNKYLIVKKKNDKAITYFEYDKMEGLSFQPKNNVKMFDGINVNKVVVINPSLINKISNKKLDLRFRKIIKLLSTIYETDEDSDEGLNEVLNEVNRLKKELINKYKKYILEEEYEMYMKKIMIINEEIKNRLYYLQLNYRKMKENNMVYEEKLENHKSR